MKNNNANRFREGSSSSSNISMIHAGGDNLNRAALNYSVSSSDNINSNANIASNLPVHNNIIIDSHGETTTTSSSMYNNNTGTTSTATRTDGKRNRKTKSSTNTTKGKTSSSTKENSDNDNDNDSSEDWLELPESFRPSRFDVIVGWARQNYHHGTYRIASHRIVVFRVVLILQDSIACYSIASSCNC